ncbi:MAG: tRNA (5-methylaminomethyl-2-thiouridine)(34)-methyltransferase MnmD [Flavobacteriales bacterium]
MTNPNDIQLITTGDGSSSLLNVSLGETYHSRHGALRESMHVFIESGLHQLPMEKEFISILEIGFGTGLNAWLTMLANGTLAKQITYTALETNPLDLSVISNLNYAHESSDSDRAKFLQLHEADWNTLVALDGEFGLHKIQISLQEFDAERTFDLIYFDAFGPPVQPEMWTIELFQKLFAVSNPGAVLVTYCAKGQVRRDLQTAGWEVERLPGPPGKREMLRALKPSTSFA